MSSIFEKQFAMRWSDLDPNNHMRHSVYADLCAATRLYYLESIGYSMKKFGQLQLGPILFEENLRYLKEVMANDSLRVNVMIAGHSADGRKWKIRHVLTRVSDGKTSAIVDVTGAWFSLKDRKVTAPPQDLQITMESLPKTEDFVLM